VELDARFGWEPDRSRGPRFSAWCSLALVTWAQRDDPHWFCARIPNVPISLEFVEVGDNPRSTIYRRLIAHPLWSPILHHQIKSNESHSSATCRQQRFPKARRLKDRTCKTNKKTGSRHGNINALKAAWQLAKSIEGIVFYLAYRHKPRRLENMDKAASNSVTLWFVARLFQYRIGHTISGTLSFAKPPNVNSFTK